MDNEYRLWSIEQLLLWLLQRAGPESKTARRLYEELQGDISSRFDSTGHPTTSVEQISREVLEHGIDEGFIDDTPSP